MNNKGLQYFHKYNILIPTVTKGFYNLQEEIDDIMISNTTQDSKMLQLNLFLFRNIQIYLHHFILTCIIYLLLLDMPSLLPPLPGFPLRN